MPYVDPNTIHNPSTGGIAPASWGDVIRDDLEFLIDPPACSLSRSTNQTVGTSTSTATDLTADTEAFDNDAMHSLVTNTERITFQTAGNYLVIATVEFDGADTDGERVLRFLFNNVTVVRGMRIQANAAVSNFPTALTLARFINNVVAGDFVTCQVRQNSGSSLAVSLVEFSATYLTR